MPHDNHSASRAASILGRRDDDEENSPTLFSMSVRLPSDVACTVSVMAKHAGCSRNEMLNMIIKSGVSAILALTAGEVVAEIQADVESDISDFIY